MGKELPQGEFKPNLNTTFQVRAIEGLEEKTETELWQEWESISYDVKNMIDFKGFCELRKIFNL